MLLLKNCRILDSMGHEIKRDIQIVDGKIASIEEHLEDPTAQIIDLHDQLVTPGLIDVHVHWREPGFSYKETIEQASRAAARGGFTLAMPMPNLNPVPDSLERLQEQLNLIQQHSVIRALPYGAITMEEKGIVLANLEELSSSVFAFSDDGCGVQNAAIMYRAMQTAARLQKPIVAHCEDNSLIFGGCMHDGKRSRELGLSGIPSVCESVQIARDVLLAEAANCHYHVCHVSTKESVRIIRDAKRAGIHVTCEVTPHHLISCEDDITTNDGKWKMNPPLRSTADRQALLEGVLDGTIDIIATDHAPHAADEKKQSMVEAAFGIVGSETAFAQLYTYLVKPNHLTLAHLIDLMSKNVAKIFNLPYGRLEVGQVADLAVFDLNTPYTINPTDFLSKGHNTPYVGTTVYGMATLTIVGGEVVFAKT